MNRNMKKGMLVIISGPSGSGKGTVLKSLHREDFARSVSMTTREKRVGEVHGKDYFFCTKEEFIRARDQGELLEHAEFVGNMYGTPKFYVENQIKLGKAVILEIDVAGALQVKEKFADSVSIFLMPPGVKDLITRLKERKTEDLDTIFSRIKRAKHEIEYIPRYDYLVINNRLEQAIEEIYNIIDCEYLKPHRNMEFIERLKGDNFNVESIIFGTDDNTERK